MEATGELNASKVPAVTPTKQMFNKHMWLFLLWSVFPSLKNLFEEGSK